MPPAATLLTAATLDPPAPDVLLRAMFRTAVLSALVFGVVRLSVRDNRQSGLVAAFALPALLFGGLMPWLLPACAVLTAWGWFRREHLPSQVGTVLLNAFGAFILVASLWTQSGEILPGNPQGMRPPPPVALHPPTPAPDIWHILLDGYGSAAFTGPAYGCPGGLHDALAARGFTVPARARANYPQTLLSMTSMLNAVHLEGLVDAATPRASTRRALQAVLRKNRAFSSLRGQGYAIEHIRSEYSPLSVDARTRAPALTLDILDYDVLAKSAFALLPRWDGSPPLKVVHDAHVRRVRWAVDAARTTARAPSGPTLRLVHLLTPHPPFVVRSDGTYRPDPTLFVDGSHWAAIHGGTSSYAEGYCEKQAWTDGLVLPLIDDILAHARTPPIIIVHGDHGPGAELDWSEVVDDATERFGVLLAVYAPPSVTARLHDDVSLVNVYPAIFSGVFGADLPEVPDRSFYAPFDDPLDFTDVTDRFHFSD